MAIPHSLLVLKDGHVGSEWFSESIARQPGTRFLFEMGACITNSLEGKRAFFGANRRGCACSKSDCAMFRTDAGIRAPCLDAPSRHQCHVLGGSLMSMASEREADHWSKILQNRTDITILVQTRSNLVKWAWSFYRTGAMKRLRGTDSILRRERIHLRAMLNRSRSAPMHRAMHVDPGVLLRMIISKQERSRRLVEAARYFASMTTQRKERVLLYESMQADLAGELRKLYAAMNRPFHEDAHNLVPAGSLVKHAPEDLSTVIANWEQVEQTFRRFPCLHAMLVDTSRRIFDDCGDGMGYINPETGSARDVVDPTAPCACSWRTPIIGSDGELLDDNAARNLTRNMPSTLAAARPMDGPPSSISSQSSRSRRPGLGV